MNKTNLLAKLGFVLMLFVLLGSTALAQTYYATVYVDVTNGSDGYTGENATNTTGSNGPKASITAGLAALDTGGKLVIFAGTYTGATNNVEIKTATYAKLTTGLTIELRVLGANTDISIDNAANSFIFNISGQTLTIASVGGAVLKTLDPAITLTAGSINLDAAASWVLASGTTLNFVGASAFTNAAPTKTTIVSLSYTGTGSFTAGPESNYGGYGSGTITVNKTSGTVVFPNNITAVAGITVQSGASATFSGTIAMGAFDITNSSTGTVTFNGTVGFSYKDAVGAQTDIGQVVNTAGGSIVFAAAVTWTGPTDVTAAKDFDAAGFHPIDNQLGGSILFNSITLLGDAGTALTNAFDVTMKALNNSGTLTLGSMTAASVSGTGSTTARVILNVTNSTSGGTLNLAGTANGAITNGHSAATTNLTGAVTLRGVLTNAGTLNLGSNDLTLSVANTHLTTGGTVSGTGKIICTNTSGTATFNGGTLGNVQVNGTSGTVNFITNAFTATTLDLTAGTVGLNIGGTSTTMNVTGATVSVATTIVQTVTDFNQSGGTFSLVAGTTTTLNVKGNLNRTGGTFTANSVSLVSFTGTAAQSVSGGPLFTTDKLTFNNVSGTITVSNSIRATGDVLIAPSTNVNFSTLNVILKGATNGITNNGTYSATGGGGIILGGVNTIADGVAGTGYTMQGTGTYSYVTVDVGDVSVAQAAAILSTSQAAGVLTITMDAAHTLAVGNVVLITGHANIPAGYYVVQTSATPAFTISSSAATSAVAGGAVAVYNTAKVTTTVTGVKWNGALTLRSGALEVGTASVDFGPTGTLSSIVRYPAASPGILTLTGATFNSANISYDLTYTGALGADKSVGGELTASPANVRLWTISTTGAGNNDLPVASNVSFGGTLTVSAGALLRIPTGGTGETFTLSGASKNHVIAGTVVIPDAADAFVFSGANSTLNGSTVTADAATIGHVQFNATGLTVSNIQLFSGKVTTGAASTVTLGMGAAAADQVITGLLSLGGSSFTLATNVEVRAGVAHTLGSLNFGAYDLKLTTAGNFAGSGGTYTSTGGYLVMNFATATLATASAVPNVKILAATTLAGAVEVSGIYQQGVNTAVIPVVSTAGNNLTISGATINIAGNADGSAIAGTGTGADDGNVIITNAAAVLTMDGASPTIEELTVNITSGSLTLAGVPAATQRTLTISDGVAQTKGDINTGIHILALTGEIGTAPIPLTQAAGNIYSTTDGTSTGRVAFSFAAAAGLATAGMTIDNLYIGAAATHTTPTKQLTVNKTLWLFAGAFDTGDPATVTNKSLILADAVSIIRNTGTLAYVPAFGANVDVTSVVGGITQDKEVPAATTTYLRNFTNTAGTFTMNANMSVKGTLTLTAGNITNGGKVLTLVSGATLKYEGGVLTQAPSVTNYNLTYATGAGAALATTNTEFISGKVDLLTVSGTAGIVLNANKGIKDLTLNSTAATGIDLAGKVLTLTGNMTYTAGTIAGAAGSSLTYGGTTAQTITVPTAGWTLPASSNITINNPAGVSLVGGDLKMGTSGIVYFVNGIFNTGAKAIQFNQTSTGQGFDNSGVVAPNKSHVVGKAKHAITAGAGTSTWSNGRYEFPVGTLTSYSPASITFTSTYPAINPTTVEVQMVDASPSGTAGLPLDAGSGAKVGGYPNYYWLMKTTPSAFTSTQAFDIELQGSNLGYPFTSASDLRIIRRQDGDAAVNPWSLQGTAASYQANYITVAGVDTTVFVRSSSSIGGLVNAGTRFSIGIPTRSPVFTAAPATASVDENAALALQYTADPRDVGESITYALVNPPTGAAINASTGAFTWTPTYAQGGSYTLTVSATDGQYTTTTTTAVTVVNINRAPAFTTAGTLANGSVAARTTFTFTYAATDADAQALTYAIVAGPAGATIDASTGVLSWWVTTEQVSPPTQTITVSVTDGIATVNTTATVTVTAIARVPVFTTAGTPPTTTVSVAMGSTYTFTYAAADSDGTALTYSIVSGPTGATIGATSGVFSWAVPYGANTTYPDDVVVVRASNGTLYAEKTLTLARTFVNVAPAFTTAGQLTDRTVFAGDVLDFTYAATDANEPSASVLRYSPALSGGNSTLPSWMTLDPVTGRLSGTAAATQTAIYLIKIYVTDPQGLTTFTQALLTVQVVTVNISGTVTYGTGTTPVSAATVTLTPATGAALTATTSTAGAYSFAAVSSGTYTLAVTKTGGHPTVNTNAADALRAALYPTSSSAIGTALALAAADVNNDAIVNAADALQIMLRYVGTLTSFAKGDWIFVPASSTITAGSTNITDANAAAIAVGDVNVDAVQASGTFFAKVDGSAQSVVPATGPTLRVNSVDAFEVPVRVKAAASIGSISMAFQYPTESATFLGVRGPDGMVSAANDGVVAVAWFNADNALNLKENDAVVMLRFKPTGNVKDFSLTLDPNSQITDAIGNLLSGINLEVPAVDGSLPTAFAIGQNYPNPFNPSTTIQYDLPAAGHVTLVVYNMLGQIVDKLVDDQQNAGAYKIRWDASRLSSGVYMYHVTVDAGKQTFKEVRRMTLLK